MVTGQSVPFVMDSKYLIPTALRKERRRVHAQHVFSERAFRAVEEVPLGRPEDVDLRYDVPYRIRREIPRWELLVPKTVTYKQRNRRRRFLLVVIALVLWTVLANIG